VDVQNLLAAVSIRQPELDLRIESFCDSRQ
jgi:hypothetical protein